MNFQCELHNYCNFTCGHCVYKDMERKKQFMSDEVWRAVLHRYIVPYQRVNLNAGHNPTFIGHNMTEPLIDRKLASRLKDVSDACPNMNLDIYSNGVLLPAWAKRGEDFFEFLGGLPNRCRYLMSFHPVNHDDSVNDYTEAFAYMHNILRNPPRNVEIIMVAHLTNKTTKEKLLAWKDTWLPEIERGVLTVHANVGLNPWTGRITEPGTVEFHGCPYGDFGHLFIGVTGNIISCCMDLEEEIVHGNVLVDDPDAMMAKLTDFYAEQRRIQQERTGLRHSVCANCFGLPKPAELVQIGGVA